MFLQNCFEMKLLIFVFVGLSSVSLSQAQRCFDNSFVFETDDTATEDEFTLTASGTVQSFTCKFPTELSDLTLFEITYTGNNVTLKKTEDFLRIDELLDANSPYPISMMCTGTCDSSNAEMILINLYVTDTNTHEPVWTIADLELPMPLPAGLDITYFGPDIITTDLDFSNTEVTYEILDTTFASLFKVGSTKDGKDYKLSLTTVSTLSLLNGISFDIKATDNGVEPLSSTATLTITINDDSSIKDKPSFQSSSYSYNFVDSNPPEIKPVFSGSITIDTIHPESVELVDVPAELECAATPDTDTVKVECTYKSADPLTKTTLFTLKAKTQEAAETTLIVNVQSSGDGPQFKQTHYTGTYKQEDNTITLDAEITTTDEADSVIVSGDEYKDALKFTKNSADGKIWDVSVEDASKFKDPTIVIDIVATVEDLQGPSSVIVLTVPTEALSFEEPYYQVNYEETTEAGVTLIAAKVLGNNLDDTKCSLTEESVDLADYLSASYDGTTQMCNVNVDKPFDETILAKSKILMSLVATLGATTAKTTLVVTLPTTTNNLNFEKPYYTATYTIEQDKGKFNLDPIPINGDNLENLTPSWSEESIKVDEFLKTSYEKGTILITLDKDFSDDILSETEIYLGLVVTDADHNEAKTTIIVSLPEKAAGKPPTFDAAYYTGVYNKDNTLDPIEKITVTSDKIDAVKLQWVKGSIDNPETYFELSQSAGVVEVKQLAPLDADILAANTELVLGMEAFEPDNSNKGSATLVITLPGHESADGPSFNEVYYIGTYTKGDPKDELTINNGIEVTSKTDITIDLTWNVEGVDVKAFLSSSYDSDKKQVTISLKDNFPDNVLVKSDVIVTIEATDANSNVGEGVLIISLPDDEQETGPKFKKNHYSANYNVKENTFVVDEDIVIESDILDNIQITFEYSDDVTPDDYLSGTVDTTTGKCSIAVEKKFPSISKDVFIVTIIATDATSKLTTSTTIIVYPIREDSSDPPEFVEDHYIGNYNVEKETVELETNILFKVGTTDQIDLSGTGSENFEMKKGTDGVWTVEVKTPLEDEVLHRDNMILQMTAVDGSDTQGRATLIIELPALKSQFNQRSYSASYSDDNKFTVKDKISIVNYLSSVEPKIQETEYQQYFKIAKNNDVVTLEKSKDLSNDILKNSFITITISLVDDSETKDSSLLTVALPLGGGNNDDDDDSDKSKSVTGYVIAVAILAVLLAGTIAGFVFLYFFKLRKSRKYNSLDDQASIKKSEETIPEATRSDTIKRRATGFAFTSPPPEEESENEKTVTFNDQIEKYKIEKSADASDNEEEEAEEEEKNEESDDNKSEDDITHV